MKKLDLSINPNQISNDFDRIAEELMNKWILKVNNFRYRITEIEFYLNSASHNDSYTHGHEYQKTSGQWYFHGSGIDITFGSEEFFGGILIRGIYNLDNKKYINGPLKTVTELFGGFDSIFLKNFEFGLTPDLENKIEIEDILKAPRVGLNPKKDLDAFNKFYRYLVMPQYEHKDKTQIYNALIEQGYSPERANIIWKQ